MSNFNSFIERVLRKNTTDEMFQVLYELELVNSERADHHFTNITMVLNNLFVSGSTQKGIIFGKALVFYFGRAFGDISDLKLNKLQEQYFKLILDTFLDDSVTFNNAYGLTLLCPQEASYDTCKDVVNKIMSEEDGCIYIAYYCKHTVINQIILDTQRFIFDVDTFNDEYDASFVNMKKITVIKKRIIEKQTGWEKDTTFLAHILFPGPVSEEGVTSTEISKLGIPENDTYRLVKDNWVGLDKEIIKFAQKKGAFDGKINAMWDELIELFTGVDYVDDKLDRHQLNSCLGYEDVFKHHLDFYFLNLFDDMANAMEFIGGINNNVFKNLFTELLQEKNDERREYLKKVVGVIKNNVDIQSTIRGLNGGGSLEDSDTGVVDIIFNIYLFMDNEWPTKLKIYKNDDPRNILRTLIKGLVKSTRPFEDEFSKKLKLST